MYGYVTPLAWYIHQIKPKNFITSKTLVKQLVLEVSVNTKISHELICSILYLLTPLVYCTIVIVKLINFLILWSKVN